MVRTIPLRPGMRIPFRNLLHDDSSGGLIVKHGAENDYLHLDITNDAVVIRIGYIAQCVTVSNVLRNLLEHGHHIGRGEAVGEHPDADASRTQRPQQLHAALAGYEVRRHEQHRLVCTVELRSVTIARWRDETALIASGVKDGEIVATAGVHKLEPGQKVRPIQQAVRP